MIRTIQPEIAVVIIEGAFAPLRCVAELWDGNYRIRFRVFDASDIPLLNVAEILQPQFTDPQRFSRIINTARSSLIKRGIDLEPWSFPGDC